jgi:hypothetical protein
MLGAYRHLGGANERVALDAAIDGVVADLGIVARGVARQRLFRANPIPKSLVLAADKRSLMLAYDAELFTAPLVGTPAKVRCSTGEEVDLRLVHAKGGFDLVFSTEGKSRTNHLSRQDGALLVDVTVRAEGLPRALTYRLTYGV